jgi:hypothetical protein
MIAPIVIVFSLQSCTANKYGAATPERLVEEYLLALETSDENLLLQLLTENVRVTGVFRSKLLKFGGRKIQNRQISYTRSKPTLWRAKIQGFFIDSVGVRQNFDDSILIEYQSKGRIKFYGGRWYLLL